MDITTFYALFSATCFAMVGFWWNLLQGNPHWLRDPHTRPAVGGVYLALLLPALMGLFAQVGGPGTTTIWRISFVAIAVVGMLTTLRALPHSRRADVDDTRTRVATIVIYLAIAVVGVFPELGKLVELKAIQVEAMLLILLVLSAHGLVWRFMTQGPVAGRHEAVPMSPADGPGR